MLLTSLLISQFINAAELCYDPEQDIGEPSWIKQASLLLPALESAQRFKQAVCVQLKTPAEQQEAALLIELDSTGRTLYIK